MHTTDRFAEFEARADQVRKDLQQALPPELGQYLDSQFTEAERSTSAAQAIIWLRKAASTLGKAIAPLAACKSGCSACCHTPVMLLASEAKVIANELGVALKLVPLERRNLPAPSFRGEGHACLFLKNDACSIYETSRPLACRTLYNLDKDSYLCQHREQSNLVPYFDAGAFTRNAVIALVRHDDDYIAELRDFFT